MGKDGRPLRRKGSCSIARPTGFQFGAIPRNGACYIVTSGTCPSCRSCGSPCHAASMVVRGTTSPIVDLAASGREDVNFSVKTARSGAAVRVS